MRRLIIILLLLIASVWGGVLAMRHPGFLLIVYQPWMVQMPLWFALISVLVFLGLFYFIIDSIDRVGFLWFRLKNWLHIRREHKAYSKTQAGLATLIEGRYKKAERLLLAGTKQSIDPLINYLSAARAAHKQGAYDRRDSYIQKAYEIAPKASLAIGLTQAELEAEQGQFEQAIATLTHLRQVSPRHPQVIKLLEKIYVRLGDWNSLKSLLPAMRKARVLNHHEYALFEKNIYCEIFHAASGKRLSDVRQIWNEVPRHLKKQPDIVLAYVTQLLQYVPVTGPETSKEIEELIRKILKHTFHPALANIYGRLHFTDLNRQLVIAGAWVNMYGQKPELLFILGSVCMRLQLWGKAKDYFSRCLAQGPNPRASLAYGRLLESLGEKDEAMQKYREGLSCEIGG
jgi:HemY protein